MGALDFLKQMALGMQNGVQQMGAGFQPPADPSAIDPQTGVPAGDAHAAQMQSLRNMSALFLAAGQSQSGADRAKILAQLGEVNDPSKQFYTMAQARLMNNTVQEADRKRQQTAQVIEKLRGVPIQDVADDRETALYNAYLDAGDPQGALDMLAKARARTNQGVMLDDGSEVTRGVVLQNQRDFQKNWAPTLAGLDDSVIIGNAALDAVEGGLFSGATADMQMAAAKLARAAGINADVSKITNTEQLRSAIVQPVLERMQQLGGNDSNEELQTMMASLAGGSLEKETLETNMRRFLKTKLMAAGRANEQFKRLHSNGQQDYGGYVNFTPDLIPGNYRSAWDRATQNDAGGSGASAPAKPVTAEDFAKLPSGSLYIDPDDGKTYRK